jgi:hypothetical protein
MSSYLVQLVYDALVPLSGKFCNVGTTSVFSILSSATEQIKDNSIG